MPLAAANVTADDVDPDTPGTYHVTITITDSQGATTSKTFTVVVQAKEGGETPEPEPDPSPGPEPTPEPAPSRHQTRRRIKQPTRSRMTRQMGNRQTTAKQSCRILVPASWSR